MRHLKNKSGFTLLEIIIVIIIVGVLASLALPRFFATVEFSRSTEALAAITAIRQSMERCYLQKNGNYTTCTTFAVLDLENPANSPNSHFTYGIPSANATAYVVTATRNTRDGGVNTSGLGLAQDLSGITRSGVGAFQGIN